MRWTDVPIHFIDFEGNAASGILEFGAVTLRGGEMSETRTSLCRAIGAIRPEDQSVHGLSVETVSAYSTFTEHWDYFCGLRASGPLAAHFSQAENHLIRSAWSYPRQMPDFARPGRASNEWGPWIDTGRLYPQFFKNLQEVKLEWLVATFGLQGELDRLAAKYCPPERTRYHAALYDALAGALLLRDLLKRPEFSAATIPWLLQMSTLDGEKRGALQQGDLF